MTALKRESAQITNQLPVATEKIISPKMQTFLDLEKMKLHVSEDFDYEKELEESRELKYGSIS